MSDDGYSLKVIHASAYPAMAVDMESGIILEVNSAATVVFNDNQLQNRDIYSVFPRYQTHLRHGMSHAQRHGSFHLYPIDRDGGSHALLLVPLDAHPSVLLMTVHPDLDTIVAPYKGVSALETVFPPIALEPTWQLLPPRDQLHHLLIQIVATWNVKAVALLLCHPHRTVIIDQIGESLPWQEIPVTLYAPLERALQRGASPCLPFHNYRLQLAPLFVETNDTAWGAVAFTVNHGTASQNETAARYVAGIVSAILAHAHQKYVIATHDQQRLRAINQRDQLVRYAQRGVLFLNPAGEIEVLNDRACELLNWKREDVWQRPIKNLLGTLGTLGAKLGSALLATPTRHTELSGRLERRNQRGRDLDFVLEPVPEEAGAYWLLINDPSLSVLGGAVPDETSQTLGRLHQLNVTVHEMKTPLTGLVWQLEVLDDMIQKSTLPPESPIFATLATVRQKVDQALSVMDDVKGWVSTGQKPNFDFCDLKVIAEEAIVTVEQARRGRLHRPIRIRRAFEALVPLVEGDARRLHQMVTNLIKNAAEAITKDEGEVEVLLRPLRRDQLATYKLSPEKNKILNNGVELRVRDTGLGITKAQQQRIFDPEVSFKLGGSGIGLWVVRTVVEQHGGEILVESEIGNGTTFTILLPQRVEGIVVDS